MGVTELDLKVLALESGTVANANKLKLLGIALAYALDHVVDEGAGKAMEALCLTGIVGTGYDNLFALYLDGEDVAEFASEFALAALYGNNVAVNLDVNTGRNSNRHLTNTRH